jgi:hypothetical protein
MGRSFVIRRPGLLGALATFWRSERRFTRQLQLHSRLNIAQYILNGIARVWYRSSLANGRPMPISFFLSFPEWTWRDVRHNYHILEARPASYRLVYPLQRGPTVLQLEGVPAGRQKRDNSCSFSLPVEVIMARDSCEFLCAERSCR